MIFAALLNKEGKPDNWKFNLGPLKKLEARRADISKPKSNEHNK